MYYRNMPLYVFFLSLFVFAGTAGASILATSGDIANGQSNLSDPVFIMPEEVESGLDAAIKSILTNAPETNAAAKTAILRSLREATDTISMARGLPDDVSSICLYEALLVYDLMADKNVFSGDEKQILRAGMHDVLNRYGEGGVVPWDDDRWGLGVAALRIAASEALFALNFPDDPASDRMRQHSLACLQKNLREAIDDYGAWKHGPPSEIGEAVEYLVVAGKVFANAGLFDIFTDIYFKRLLRWNISVLPPRSPALRDEFITPSLGETKPDYTPAAELVLAAGDIAESDPGLASEIMWYWSVTGKPVSPLGVLFMNLTIEPVEPPVFSSPAGNGVAVIRNNAVAADASYAVVGFGPPEGFGFDYSHDHADRGDFSFVWRGTPIIVHDGAVGDAATSTLLNREEWRHNKTLYDGAGDSPVIDQNILSPGMPRKDVMGHAAPSADFYPDGIRQFMTTPALDYVSGDVSVAPYGRHTSYVRHLLMLKPDALLVWDQIESPYNIEWNLWAPADNLWTERNILRLSMKGGVELHTHFVGESSLTVTTEPFPQNRNEDWPVVMKTAFGGGTITLLFADIFSYPGADTISLPRAFLENALSAGGKPSSVGVISSNAAIPAVLKALGIAAETLTYESVKTAGLSRFDALVIGSSTTAAEDRILFDFGGRINDYISRGGDVLAVAASSLPWLTRGTDKAAMIPVAVGIGACPISYGDAEKELILADSPFWQEPNVIAGESWFNPAAGADSPVVSAPKVFAGCIPSEWSSAWTVLASVRHQFPLVPHRSAVFGRPSRIRAKHPASRDFMTLFLPRKSGELSYPFEVRRMERGLVTIADPTTTWEIKAGETAWTDANLSVLVDSLGVRRLYAFDCTVLRFGNGSLKSDEPISVYYSERETTGLIMTATNNRITSARHEMHPYAGEFRFRNLFGSISLERLSYLSTLTVKSAEGAPAAGVKVYGDTGLLGATDAKGTLVIRWKNTPPTVRLTKQETNMTVPLVPGLMDIIFPY